jgi:2-aminoadipate transaminase
MHDTPWENRYAQRTQRMKSSAIRELLKLTLEPGLISFAGGMPAPEVFPYERFREACNTVLLEKGSEALQYGTSEGYTPLLEMIARHTAQQGINVGTENIMITSGSQQALDLLGKILINNGDRVLVEAPTYLGALQAWNAYGAEYVAVPSDANGMITEELESYIRLGPKFIYVLPNFQNPSGTTLSLERRKRLVEIADKYGVPIVEDDPYGQLRYEGSHLPSVGKLDGEYRNDPGNYSGNVIYLSTFSKIMAPGIRLAWVVAPAEVIRKLVQAKQAVDLHTSTFNQIVAHEVGKGGFLNRHIETICATYHKRRDAMLEMLEEHMPKGVEWTRPEGGLFLWAKLPEGCNSTDLLVEAVKEKVAFVPGAPFYPCGGGENAMRLNFSFAKEEMINEGVSRLAKVISSFIT